MNHLWSLRDEWYRVHTAFKTHFPKDRNCEICQRTNVTRAPCRRRIGGVLPRAENIGDLITAGHKFLSEGCEYLETITDMQLWCKTCLLSGFNFICAKQKLRRKLKGACKSSWNPPGNPKSFTPTNPWNLAKPVTISRGIIAHQPLAVQKPYGVAEGAVHRMK